MTENRPLKKIIKKELLFLTQDLLDFKGYFYQKHYTCSKGVAVGYKYIEVEELVCVQ